MGVFNNHISGCASSKCKLNSQFIYPAVSGFLREAITYLEYTHIAHCCIVSFLNINYSETLGHWCNLTFHVTVHEHGALGSRKYEIRTKQFMTEFMSVLKFKKFNTILSRWRFLNRIFSGLLMEIVEPNGTSYLSLHLILSWHSQCKIFVQWWMKVLDIREILVLFLLAC